MFKKHSSWIDNEIVYCHLQEILPVFRYGSQLMDRPAGACHNMSHTKSAAQKVDITYHILLTEQCLLQKL